MVVLIIFLAMVLGYMIRLYLRARWRTIELMATLIAGSTIPAMLSNQMREKFANEDPDAVTAMLLIIVLGQLLALAGTLIGMEWIKRRRMEATLPRMVVIAYGWLVLPAFFIFAGSVIGLLYSYQNNGSIPILLLTAMISGAILLPANKLAGDPPPAE